MKKPGESRSSASATILDAARTIRSGGLVVFPTETVYGLGADALAAEAVERIFAAKGRPPDNPLIVHIADSADLDRVAGHVPAIARDLFARFAPGPLTLVLPAHPDLAPAVTAGLATVAVRFPAHPVAIELLRTCGRPLAAPSANRSGEPSPTTVAMARASLGDAVGVYLDGGRCRVGLESTVASVSDDTVRILRPGAVTAEEIGEAVGGARVEYAAIGPAESAPSPGLRHRHYQPHAEVVTVEADDLEDGGLDGARLAKISGPIGVIGVRDDVPTLVSLSGVSGKVQIFQRVAADTPEYARNLYRWFDELDELGVRMIIAILPTVDGIGLALRDRLDRASGGRMLG